MLISTWNVRGYTLAKIQPIQSLMRSSDFVCLTETWSRVPDTDHWNSCTAIPPLVNGRPRTSGGVAILYKKQGSFKPISTYAEAQFQLVHGVADGVPILGAYIVPRIPKAELGRILEIASRCLRGPGILVGDLNSRHHQWDDTYNFQGILLQKWARRHNFLTTRPPDPTFSSHSGRSRVDLVFHRSAIPPTLTVLPETSYSDHRPVLAEMAHVPSATMRQLPLAVVNNEDCRLTVKGKYEKSLPPLSTALSNCSTAASLELNSRRLCVEALEP